MTTATPTTDPAHLTAFLADHDLDCPGCGYNLHGASTDRCPECGRGLTLGIVVERSTLWRRQGLLVLILTWLVLAGAMNATRTARTIETMVTARQGVQIVTQRGVAAPQVIWSIPEQNIELTFPASEAPGLTARNAVLNYNLARTRPPSPRMLGTSGPNWSAVSWQLWTRLAAWGSLALAAVAGLALTLIAWRRPGAKRVATVAMAIAWLGFAGYFAYHGYSFAMELI